MNDQKLEDLLENIRTIIIEATGGPSAPPEVYIDTCEEVIGDLKNMIQCVKQEHGLNE